MMVNSAFIGMFVVFVTLIASGYFIVNPSVLGYCVNFTSDIDCFGQDVYFGVGKPLLYSTYPLLIMFVLLSFIPARHLYWWYRIVIPIGVLGALAVFVSPPLPTMFDPDRVTVLRNVSFLLLFLSLATVGYSLVASATVTKGSNTNG
jgi:hypothetical protein